MTLKSLFLTDAIENLKRRAWVFWGSFLIFFCSYPGFLLVTLNNLKSRYDPGEAIVSMKNYVMELYTANGIIGCLVIGLGLLFGIQGYAYLHDKRQVNFYHSQPVKRSRRFFVLWFNGVFLFLVTYLINFLLGMAVAAAYGCLSTVVFISGWVGFIFYLMLFLSVYHIAMIAVILTGHTLVSLLAVGVLLFYEIAVRGITLWYKDSFLLTNSMQGDEILYCITSPLTAAFGLLKYRDGRYPWQLELFPYGKTILHLAALLVAFCIIAFLLYKKRPMEGYGKNISFKIVKEPVRILLLALLGVTGALLFYEMAGKSMLFGIAGAVFTLFLGHVVIQMIYEVDLRAVRKNLSSLAVALVFTLCFFLFFCYDPLEMDARLPAKSKVEAVAIELPGVASGNNHWVLEDGREIWGMEYSWNMMHLTDLDMVYQALEQAINPKEFRNMLDQPSDKQQKYYSIHVYFHKKNGKKESRRLYFKQQEIGRIFASIYGMEEYQKTVNQTTTENFLEKYRIFGAQYFNGLQEIRLEENLLSRLYEAYQKDLKTVGYEVIYSQIPVGKILWEGTGLLSVDFVNRWEVLIYPGFENTINLLEKEKVEWKADFASDFKENIDYIQVVETDYENWGFTSSKDREDYIKTIIYKDKKNLEKLLKHAIPKENIYWCNGETLYNTSNKELEIHLLRTLGEEESKRLYGEYYEGEGKTITEIIYKSDEFPAIILEDLESIPYGDTLTK